MTDLRNRGQVHPLFCLLLFWLAPYNVQTPILRTPGATVWAPEDGLSPCGSRGRLLLTICFVALCPTPHTPIFGLGLGMWIGGWLWLRWKLALLNDSNILRYFSSCVETSFHWLKVSYFLRFLHL